MRFILAAAAAAFLFAMPARAHAAPVDVATFTCSALVAGDEAGGRTASGWAAILYWIAGYHASDTGGTVVDFDKLIDSFGKITEHCKANPGLSVLNVAAELMTESEPAAGRDLSLISCERVLNTPKQHAEGLGQILMWLAGYHAGLASDSVLDLVAFEQSAREIGDYCAANPHIGLYTASERFMGPAPDDE